MPTELPPWTCESCGHTNIDGAVCEVCGADRPKPPAQRELTPEEAAELQERRDAGLA